MRPGLGWIGVLPAVGLAACGGGDRPAGKDPRTSAARRPVRLEDRLREAHGATLPVPERRAGPRRNPPIDEPRPKSQARADAWLSDRGPVLAVELGGRARAYPVQILVWHEIVNDRLGRRPIAVTYCPLCNSSLVFDRRVLRSGRSASAPPGTCATPISSCGTARPSMQPGNRDRPTASPAAPGRSRYLLAMVPRLPRRRLIGTSRGGPWGGPIGLWWATRHTHRVRSLFILNTFAHRPPGDVPPGP